MDRRLKEIRLRAESIPSEPFVLECDDGDYECPLCEGDGYIDAVVHSGPNTFAAGWEAYGIGKDLEAMKQFALHAREDVLFLLQEVERLRHVEAVLALACETTCCDCNMHCSQALEKLYGHGYFGSIKRESTFDDMRKAIDDGEAERFKC